MNLRQWWVARKLIKEAYKAKKITGLPASIVASQAIWETGWLKKIPVDTITGKKSFNILGIKAIPKKGYVGSNGFVTCGTHEYINSVKTFFPKATFRAYHNYYECFLDYGRIIYNSKRKIEGVIIQRYKEAIKYKNDPRRYIYEVWKAGYASDDEKYPKGVLNIAECCKFIRKEVKE